MKKKLSICLIVLLSLVLVYGFADAKVTGICSGCHTMHNSQNGSPQAYDDLGALTTTPQGHLAKASCLGCHGKGGVVVGGAPNIFAGVSTDMTAGGSFNTAIAADKHKRHDITDVFAGGDDSYAGGTVVNGTPGAAAGTLGKDMNALTLTCAGATGCHGKHTAGYDSDAGIRGFHHGTYLGYRYLQTKAGTAITGTGSATWEKVASGPGSAAQHNVYSSDATAGISKYCAECHGMFHSDANTKSGTTWVRHPTDTLLAGLTGGTTLIDITSNDAFKYTPVGFNPITTQTTTTTTTGYDKATANVICLSCHRAHGTDQDDILRFTYADQTAGTGSVTIGCRNCHVAQR